ncbi:hypothetical protein BDV38DRAFT_236974 [Aspergillus pseudotamarii]|uniref:BZIP domain-containing protein n=1 Tax=Aspergillus pseudotamarii TaxID=132259 RepID=A0A5N6T712_ASPPS|nr:uncharacterized protein BDV38DRAFT_236974 [Aspergillus pseudotamarii]KAE8142050.1 hypothetical protein BDV38DRAFT_236974 [Aspergillus pseudotamarii]
MGPNPGQTLSSTSSKPTPPDTSTPNISHPRTQYQINKKHSTSKRSYSQRQLDQIARVQTELQQVKDECEALEMYVYQLEEEREWLRYILRGEE